MRLVFFNCGSSALLFSAPWIQCCPRHSRKAALSQRWGVIFRRTSPWNAGCGLLHFHDMPRPQTTDDRHQTRQMKDWPVGMILLFIHSWLSDSFVPQEQEQLLLCVWRWRQTRSHHWRSHRLTGDQYTKNMLLPTSKKNLESDSTVAVLWIKYTTLFSSTSCLTGPKSPFITGQSHPYTPLRL